MLVRVVCAALLALGPVFSMIGAPVFAAMPAPSAAASAHCPEMALVHVDRLPASAWAPVAYPEATEDALRAKAGALHPIAGPSVHVFREDSDGRVASVIAEKAGGRWILWVADSRDGKVSARRVEMRDAHQFEGVLADACFWAEPTEISGAPADATCVDATEIHLEAILPQGHRSAVQHCSAVGLTGEAAELLWDAAGVQ